MTAITEDELTENLDALAAELDRYWALGPQERRAPELTRMARQMDQLADRTESAAQDPATVARIRSIAGQLRDCAAIVHRATRKRLQAV